MALTPNQKHKLNVILSAFNDVNDSFISLRTLIVKLKAYDDDSDIDLTQAQIAAIVAKYTAKRTALLDKVTAMPTF